MLSKEDSRRLAQLERQLRRDDPDFCTRMAGITERKRIPLSAVLATAFVWAVALVLAVIGWWIPAAVVGVWAAVIICALVFRWRPGKHRRVTDPPTG